MKRPFHPAPTQEVPRILSVEERYYRDPVFHALVDALSREIESLHLTPSEVREAAIYACQRVEERRARAIFRGGSEG